jgi:TusE/DsrC/DsvC family sulfur relay protein
MPFIEHSGIKINLDDEGYLINFDDWNEKVAGVLAEREGIPEITEERMDIIKFLRDYYRRYNYFPILHSVCTHLHQENKCINEQFIEPLKAWKIAGLPKPDDVLLTYLKFGDVPT